MPHFGARKGVRELLSLDDSRWKELKTAYGSAADIQEKLRRLLEYPSWKDGRLADPDDLLYGFLCHQGTVYTATFAALPHFIELAGRLEPRERLDLVIFAGSVEEGRDFTGAAELPDFLSRAYLDALEVAARTAWADLAQQWDELDFRYLLGAYAALRGFRRIGLAITGPNDVLDAVPDAPQAIQSPPLS